MLVLFLFHDLKKVGENRGGLNKKFHLIVFILK